MTVGVLRNGTKRALQRLIFDKPSIKDCYLVSMEAVPGVLSRNQQTRPYNRFPFLFKKIKESCTMSSSSLSTSGLPFFSTSSGSSIWKCGFIGWYLGMIKAHPVMTKSITSASIYTAADLSSQSITLSASEAYDIPRTLRMAGYGLLLAGPSMHYWFNFMSRVMPKRDVVTTFKKIFVGQVVYGPIMTAVFFSLNAVLQGENGSEIVGRLERDLVPTLRNGLMYWPMCDFVTFKFIPVHLQPLMSNSFAYLWTIYITYMASLKKVSPSKIPAD